MEISEKKITEHHKPVPMEWITRIFERLECIYKDKWQRRYSKPSELLYLKTMWQTAMYGLEIGEIKTAITMCECVSHGEPPTPIEFFHYAKKIRIPYVEKKTSVIDYPKGNPDIAKKYLSDIRKKFNRSSGNL